ncbi:21932_t:CDS:2 [Gigaspora margarita]|uniref:21932_t:CDS:1 n=1 Tax=Gigaspora margarita TaxID=4874 RepID=A0ABM8VZ52_GIGMA|nr:21932_t:CDS:2 [Gigaspora margarita]
MNKNEKSLTGATKKITVINKNDINISVILENDPSLCEVRNKLTTNYRLKIQNSICFTTKDEALIDINDEVEYKLSDILYENKIYLAKEPRINWKVLEGKFKLGNGRNYNDDKNKLGGGKVFSIVKCEFYIPENDEEIYFHTMTLSSINDLFKNKTLFLDPQSEIPHIAQQDNSEEASKYKFQYIVKAILEIKEVDFTKKFTDLVEEAIELKDLNKLKYIIENFGQFIPKTIMFGGRLHYKFTTYTGWTIQLQDSLIFGGNKEKMIQGKEDDWIFSLKNSDLWDIIEFRGPMSIFDFIPFDLKNKIRELNGKTILYSYIQDHDFEMHGLNIVELKMPQNIVSIFSNKDVDPQVFATASNMEENFPCILYIQPPPSIPKVIINCTKDNPNQEKPYRVKIRCMVVGNDLSFNSILNLGHFHLQSICCDYNALKSVLNLDNTVLFVCVSLYGYDLKEKKYFTHSLSDLKFNLLYTKYPNPNISYFKAGEDSFVEKTSKVKHPEFINFHKKGHNQTDQGFISGKNEHFFIKLLDGLYPKAHTYWEVVVDKLMKVIIDKLI